MAQRCPLCLDKSSTFVTKKAVIEHVKDGHRIENPQETLESLNIYVKKKDVKIPNTNYHWQCLKFVCEKCRFTTHLKSVMFKHRRHRGHGFGTPLKTLQMRVKLQNPQVKSAHLKNSPVKSASLQKSPVFKSGSPPKPPVNSTPLKNSPVKSALLQKCLPFGPGNLVNAKMYGYPSWPGLIFHEKSSGNFFDITEEMYFVKFFDIKKTTSGWVDFTQVTPFDPEILMEQPISPSCKLMNPALQHRLKKAIEWAEYVSGEVWDDEQRLEYFQDKKK